MILKRIRGVCILKIEIRIFANLRDILKFKQRIYEFQVGLTVMEVLSYLGKKEMNGAQFLQEIIDHNTNDLKPYVKIILNGRILFPDKALNTKISVDPTVFAIFPPIGGG